MPTTIDEAIGRLSQLAAKLGFDTVIKVDDNGREVDIESIDGVGPSEVTCQCCDHKSKQPAKVVLKTDIPF